MGWLSKFFKGASNSRVSRGLYSGRSTYIDEQSESEMEDLNHAIALSLSEQEHQKEKEPIETAQQLEEDEMLAKALQESLNTESLPRQNGQTAPSPPRPAVIPANCQRVCAGCKTPIGPGRFLSCMDSVWHPDCFCCDACDKPISDYEFSMHEDHPYHKNCYRELYHPKCDVCKDFIPTNKNGLIEYRAHPFWMQKYCPSHEDDNTPRCCSCERLEIIIFPHFGSLGISEHAKGLFGGQNLFGNGKVGNGYQFFSSHWFPS